MTVQFSYTRSELLEAESLVQADEPEPWIPRNVTIYAPVVLPGILGALMLMIGQTHSLVPYSLLVLALLAYMPIWRYHQSLEKWAARDEVYAVDSSEQGLSFTTPLAVHLYQWAAFEKLLESRNLLVLPTRGFNFAIPKRAFASKVELEEFRHFVQAHIGKAAGFPVQPAGLARGSSDPTFSPPGEDNGPS